MLCFLKMSPKGSIYKENNIGPNMDPWGTPQESGAADEENSPRWTEKLLSVRYDWNHLRAMPLIPTHSSSLDKRIEWLTISKAEVKSKRTKTAELPESTAKRRSLETLKRAVSVLWRGLKPDWNFSKILNSSRNDLSWLRTTLSNIFDKKGSLDIGLKLDKIEASKLFFFRSGWTMACLKTAGTHPELRDVLTKDTTLGPTVSKTSLTKRAGILSRGQFVGRSCLTMSERWENVTGSNCWKTAGQKEK